LNKITELLEEYSIICPKTRIIFKMDSRKDPIISKNSFKDIEGSISHVFEPKVMKCLELLTYEGEFGKIELYIPEKQIG
jgi:hypothetical protein